MHSILLKLVFHHSSLYIAGSNNNLLLFPSFWKCLSSLWNTHSFYSYITHFCTFLVNNSISVPFMILSLTPSSWVIYYFSVPSTTWLMCLLSRCRLFILGICSLDILPIWYWPSCLCLFSHSVPSFLFPSSSFTCDLTYTIHLIRDCRINEPCHELLVLYLIWTWYRWAKRGMCKLCQLPNNTQYTAFIFWKEKRNQ